MVGKTAEVAVCSTDLRLHFHRRLCSLENWKRILRTQRCTGAVLPPGAPRDCAQRLALRRDRRPGGGDVALLATRPFSLAGRRARAMGFWRARRAGRSRSAGAPLARTAAWGSAPARFGKGTRTAA